MTAAEPPRAVRVVTVAAVLLVAAVAAVVSYAHMQALAADAGERWRAYVVPLSVDGLVVAASMVLLTRRRAGLPGGWLAWSALLGGVGASLAANVAAAEPTVTARVVAAWPPIAFAVGIELLLSQRRAPVAEQVADDPPTGHPADDEPDAPVQPVADVDPVGARLAELVGAARAEGRPVGRRTVARELGVTEYKAGLLLAQTSSNGTGGTR